MEVLLLTLAALAVFAIWAYNRLVRNRNVVSEAWAGIDVQLQKRHELVPNLVATVKGYMRHEAETLEKVTLIRNSTLGELPEVAARETGLSRSIGHLFALAEDYPDLKASEGFGQLHESLAEVEEHLQYARRYYNGAVRDNNNLVESFPTNLVARLFGFRQAEFFEIELASQRAAPEIRI
jgi:LemA protein